jgi:hypothetical protein
LPSGGGYRHIEGPGGGAAGGIRGPEGGAVGGVRGPGGAVAGGIRGPNGGAAGGILGPGGSWVAGARGPGGGAAIAAKGPYGYRSYTRLPDGADYIRWGGGSYWHHGWMWYRPYYYGGSVYYGEVPAPIGYAQDELPDEGVITTVVDGVTYYYYKGTFYIQKDGKYVVVEKPGSDDQAAAASVDPQALECLRRMADFLGTIQAGRLTIRDTSDEVLESGQKIQLESTRKVAFRVPDRLAVDFENGNVTRRVVYDGKTITLFEKEQNLYAQEPMPATLSETMDTLASKYGMAMPAAELLRRGLMEKLTPELRSGEYLGTETVDGTKCHCLAFSKEWIDLQIWVQEGDKPFPQKAVIVYKKIPGTPKYSMTLSDWDLTNPPDSAFEMKLPDDARKIEMAPLDSVQ